MFMEYWVDLGINILKNGRKKHILGIFGGHVSVLVHFFFRGMFSCCFFKLLLKIIFKNT